MTLKILNSRDEDKPALLFDAFKAKTITPAELAELLPYAWTRSVRPHALLTNQQWLQMFNAVGFTFNGTPARRPVNDVTLYRGSPELYSRNWSWTTDLPYVQRYIRSESVRRSSHNLMAAPQRSTPMIWTVKAPPASVLAATSLPCVMMADYFRNEVIVNTEGLDIRPYESEDPQMKLPRPCLGCQTAFNGPGSRCNACKPRTITKPRSRKERGYTAQWDRLSKRARQIQPWCSDCGGTDKLSVDHTIEAWKKVERGEALTLQDFADGLLDVTCMPCNNDRGNARGTNVTRTT